MAQPHVFAMVLAGGEGKRLAPLTADRAKPAVPFGGDYRLVDFVLSNLVNGGYLKVVVLTQYKSHSLDRHLALTWRMSPLLGNYVTPVPAQMRRGPRWFAGSAEATGQHQRWRGDFREAVGGVVRNKGVQRALQGVGGHLVRERQRPLTTCSTRPLACARGGVDQQEACCQ
jgi:hypothetical protein